MKKFQSIIDNYITNHEKHKKYLATLLALSVVVSFAVSAGLIEPAVSMTDENENNKLQLLSSTSSSAQMLDNYAGKEGNIVNETTYSPAQVSVKELLIGSYENNKNDGSLDWASGAETPSEIAEKAKNEYFLGIAYDFCLFLEGDAKLKTADAEGRVAVGGNLIFEGNYCYQVGSGNYGYMTALKDTDDYKAIENFASAIVGGYMKNIGTLATGTNRVRESSKVVSKGGTQGYGEVLYFPPTESEFKRFVVEDALNSSATHPYCNNETKPYNEAGKHDGVEVNELAQIYKQPTGGIIDFSETFKFLRERSKSLSEKKANGTTQIEGNTITFTIPEGMENAETVYFELPEGMDYTRLEEIKFVNVPKDTTTMIIREQSSDELTTISKNVPKCNLVINCGGETFKFNYNNEDNGVTTKTTIVYTDETTDVISNDYNYTDGVNPKSANDINGWRSNNHPASSKILYNFYEATSGTINGNFNGTIFAPDATVTSDDNCTGHLSGALIAKSFEGGLEFGYRPYRGSSDILGSKAGYAVPVDKLIAGTDIKLAGASFVMTKVMTNADDEIVSSWTSGNDTKWVNIPTGADFSGDTDYTNVSDPITNTYTISETSAPDGYIKTDKTYTIKVTETVDTNHLINVNTNGNTTTIPEVVDVKIEITDNSTSNTEEFSFQIRDAYQSQSSAIELAQRKIVIKDSYGNITKVFGLNIENNTVKSVCVIDSDKISSLEDEQVITTTTSTTTTTETTTTTTTETTTTTTETTTTTTETTTTTTTTVEVENQLLLFNPVNAHAEESTTTTYSIIVVEGNSNEQSGISDYDKSGTFDNNSYYYDKDSLMIMQVPKKNLEFENSTGLLFTKVDNSENPLKGATIQILDASDNDVSENLWTWDSNTSKYTLDITKLTTNAVYHFHEATAPSGYELADDIYFEKTGDKTIQYWTDSDNKTTLDLSSSSKEIQMTDIKISGAKIELKKYDANFATLLAGAEFQLYTSNDVLVYPLTGSFSVDKDNGFSLFDTIRNGDTNYNTDYIINGYLKSGSYYLKETKAPVGYDLQENFGFRVKSDYSLEVIKAGTKDYSSFTTSGGDGYTVEFPAGGSGETFIKQILFKGFNLSNVTKIEVELNEGFTSGTEVIIHECCDGINKKTATINANGVATWDNLSISSMSQIKFQNKSYDNGLNIKEVRIYIDATPTAYNIDSIQFNSDGNIPSVKTLTFYYSDGTSSSKTNVEKSGQNWNWYLDLTDLNTENVIGVRVETGEGDNNKVIVVLQPNSNDPIMGTAWSQPNIGANDNVLFGYDKMPDSSSSTTDESLNLTIDDNGLIKVPNKKAGADMNITVNKEWIGYDDFESLKEPVTVTLKRKLPSGEVDTSFNSSAYTIVLNGSETTPWQYKWSNLDRFVDSNAAELEAKSNIYVYYVEETVPDDAKFTVTYEGNDISATGTITVKNTLKTDKISITKNWGTSEDASPNKPDKLNVTLKFTVNGGVKIQTVELTGTGNTYTGSYSIPVGATNISVEENSVPTGWKLKEITSNNNSTSWIITNIPDTNKMTVEKSWVNDTASDRPNQVYVAIYRTTENPNGNSSSSGLASYGASHFDPNETSKLVPDYTETYYTSNSINQYNDYARLLQYSLYFYDANMCGDDVTTNSAYSWRSNCHTYDTVSGGYHDAGDHVMFGLPQGFSASTLGWSYYEFKDSFEDLGLTEHYKQIMKEFCDFFVNSTTLNSDEVTKLMYQKGDGTTDHDYWGAPEKQAVSRRGEEQFTTNGASNIAAQYAAALALYYINFPNDSNSSNYLKYAKALYEFSTKYNTCASPSEYKDSECDSEQAWAAAWLYIATKDSAYKTACKSKLDNLTVEKRGYFWGDVTLGAATVYATQIDSNDSTIKSKVTNFLSSNCNGSTFAVIGDDWGSIRHNTLAQTIALIYDKYQTTASYSIWCKSQMSYILGENTVSTNGNSSTCFVSGYADNSVRNLHHRAASGLTVVSSDWAEWNNWDGIYTSDGHVIVGALSGGNGNNNSYKDNCKDHKGNEVALDYNSGLVAAAAGLYSVYKTGITYANDGTSYSGNTSATSEYSLNNISLSNNNIAVLSNEPDITFTATTSAESSCYEYNNLNYENVTSIQIEFVGTGNGGFGWKYNGYSGGEDWLSINDNPYIKTHTFDTPTNINHIKINALQWWDGASSVTVNITFVCDNSFKITSSKSMTLTEGESAPITANQSATWSSDNGAVSVKPSDDGKSCIITADSYISDDVTITATANGKTYTVTVKVSGAGIVISDISNSIKMHKNQTKTVTVSPADENLSCSSGDESIVEVYREGSKSRSVNNIQYRYFLESKNSLGDVDVTFSRNGINRILNVSVIDDLEIVGSDTMNKGTTQKLTTNNAIGSVSWHISEGDAYATIDSSTGEITAGNQDGVVKVTAIDEGGKAEFTIRIELSAVTVNTNNLEWVKVIELTAGENWQKELNLPSKDPNGNTYYYYIAEVNSLTDRTPTDKITGNNSKYYPIGYSGNGNSLESDDSSTFTVSNEKVPSSASDDYDLPMTGGQGTQWYYIAGTGILLATTIIYIRKRRRSA